ncbi:MAG: phosphotransferase [Gemmatimonadetes bacterium]|nr:phosphotransferase [Gemmatimonadota bacterium]MCY3943449.1 phosphotransferase [Gemmatimonadota bacterium]
MRTSKTGLLREAGEIARRAFGLDGTVHPLAGEIDSNFRISGSGECFLLKLAPACRTSVAELLTACLHHLATAKLPVSVPTLVPPAPLDCPPGDVPGAAPGARLCYPAHPALVPVSYAGAPHTVCAMTWIEGTLLAEAGAASPPSLLEELGAALACVDAALAGFEHPELERDFAWRMEGAPETIRRYLPEVERGAELVAAMVDRSLARLAPLRRLLPRTVIHGDANGHNVLVRSSPSGVRLAGIIDFGDVQSGWRASEVAIAAAYAMMDRSDPVAAACAIARGYSTVAPLSPEECAATLSLAALRLCLSVAVQPHQIREDPGNEYLAVSQVPAWRLLRSLAELEWRTAESRIREACGRASCL